MATPAQRRTMSTALAIFVKTPGLSPVKTRLATAVGASAATQFHRLAAKATAAVARACRPRLIPYWAVAEDDARARTAWTDFPVLHQGEGDLGERLHRVYSQLHARHGRVLLIGADAPQLTPQLLADADAALDDAANAYVLGASSDGGFWLFGGRMPIAADVWQAVPYSCADTARRLRERLPLNDVVAALPQLTDVDTIDDIPALRAALAELEAPLPAQHDVLRWLDRHAMLSHQTPTQRSSCLQRGHAQTVGCATGANDVDHHRCEDC